MKSKFKNAEDILSQLNLGAELQEIRQIILSTGLEETIKWGRPVYTFKGKNVLGIAGFKEHFGLWFFQGALLSDSRKKLINAQEGRTKAMLQWRMTSKSEIDKGIILEYIREAIENEKKGLRIASDKPVKKSPPLPAELKTALSGSIRLKAAFKKLTPGKQKDYGEYIASAKQVATKASRIQKIKPMILAGIGLNDKYIKK